MSPKFSKRMKFFLSHLAISLFIATMALLLVFIFWYPFPLSKAIGVTHLFLMMLAIDVIVGPILGFIVYKESKKSLKFDLTVIIVVQILALLYGVFALEQGRPAWIVYNVDRFELVRKNEIIDEHLDQAQSQFQQASWLQPQYVAVEFSRDKKQREDDMFAEALGGISIAQRPERYLSINQIKSQMRSHSRNLAELEKFNTKEEIEKILQKYPQADAWLPLKANAADMVVLINKEKAEVVKIVDLRPWH